MIFIVDKKDETFFGVQVTQHVKLRTLNRRNTVAAIAHEHTIISRQLFLGHVVCCQPMKRKENASNNNKLMSEFRKDGQIG